MVPPFNRNKKEDARLSRNKAEVVTSRLAVASRAWQGSFSAPRKQATKQRFFLANKQRTEQET